MFSSELTKKEIADIRRHEQSLDRRRETLVMKEEMMYHLNLLVSFLFNVSVIVFGILSFVNLWFLIGLVGSVVILSAIGCQIEKKEKMYCDRKRKT